MRSSKAIETPFLASPWRPVVELTETHEPERDASYFEDPMGHNNEARRLAATMPAPTSLPFDAQRQREVEAAAESGGFADDRALTGAFVDAGQTAYTVGNTQPLVAGRWFWHVRVSVPGPDFRESRWSAPQSFLVADERPRIESFRIDYLSCIKEFSVRFGHSDNSSAAPRVAVEFRPVRRGPRVRRSLGQTDSTGLGGASEYESFRRPRRLRVGRSYRARLVLIDSSGHVTKSRPRRVRIERC